METIKGVVFNKFQYISTLYENVQDKLAIFTNQTTDVLYNSTTLITYHANNLVVDGTINNVPKSKFAFLTNITSDIQAQINTKLNTTSLSSYAHLASPIFTGSIKKYTNCNNKLHLWIDIGYANTNKRKSEYN